MEEELLQSCTTHQVTSVHLLSMKIASKIITSQISFFFTVKILFSKAEPNVLSMKIIEVNDNRSLKAFHNVPRIIYSDDKNYVTPLRRSIEEVFNPEKNTQFRNGDANRWVLVDNNNNLYGRIAAFYNLDTASLDAQPTGGCGFFECINNQAAANRLFDVARNWLKEFGMEAMDGPINFGENFFNWGVLADGFVQQGYGMPYNKEYYKSLFEGYGFKTYYKQYTYELDITDPNLPKRFWEIAAWVAKKPNYKFEHFTFSGQKKYIADFITIHEKAWKKHDNYKPIDPDDLKELIAQSKFALEEDFIWFVYHKKEPVAFFMMIPDINQILKRLNGRMNWLNIIRFLNMKRNKVINRVRVLVMGVVPQFQRSGLESGIFWHLRQTLLKKPWYNEMELSWVGDFNHKMISLFEEVGGHHTKTHHTMRYLFDRNKAFERAPVISD